MVESIERARFTNPAVRELGQFTDAELEVTRMAKSGEPQVVEVFTLVIYEYWAPFNYPNIKVELGRVDPYMGAEFNPDGVELDKPSYGAITIVEKEPIVEVAVIGSACVPPGFVLLQAEPLEWKYPRTGVKMKIDNLWGQHIRINQWKKGVDEGWRDAGLSCADFHIPESSKVTIMAGSQMDVCSSDVTVKRLEVPGYNDAHYCIRLIRVTVKQPA
ncbi:hypothetical protein ES705_09524 [subsurface metagenome]